MKPGDPIDRYVIERVLGEGGMSVVYLARHKRLRSLHAIKVLRIDGRAIRDRLLIEGRVQASLKHPNVVSVTDVIEDGNRLALVMEYVDGPTLFSRLHTQMPVDVALDLFRGMVSGVGAAHAAGLVHRDLKPANVLLATTNVGVVPKVTDFGLVKVLSQGATRSGVMMGTPNYMSPEQVRDASSVDHRSDLWALGVMLYEMLTASTPFGGDDHLVTYNRIAEADFTPIRHLRDDLPPRVVDTVERLLSVDPDERPPSASAVLEALFDDARLEASAIDPLRFRDSLFTPGAAPQRRRGLPGGDEAPFDLSREQPAAETFREPDAPSHASLWLGVATVVGLVILAGVLVLAIIVLRMGDMPPASPTVTRDLELTLSGLPAGVDVAVWHHDGWVARKGPGPVVLPDAAVGDLPIRWTSGLGCAEGPCPEGCEAWCATGSSSVTVDPGEGLATAGAIVTAMPPRAVTLQAPVPLTDAAIDGQPGQSDSGRFVFEGIAPGRHLLTATAGDCPESARGCSDDPAVDCPPGCTSTAYIVVVPASTQPMVLDVALDRPDAPVPSSRRRAPEHITGDEFKRWIDRNPEWERESAIASGRVNRRYLRNWTPSPPGGAVTLVTFDAAMAYCAGRGGVRDLEDTPQLWTGGPDEEWRSDAGEPAALQSSGGRILGEPADRAAPERGFRCAR